MNFSKGVFTVISIVEMRYFDMPCGERFSNRVAIQLRAGFHNGRRFVLSCPTGRDSPGFPAVLQYALRCNPAVSL
ncbi:hypothetical protein [Paraburkholderia rhizosphaerae]|uniref:hypothetical protein n=1 Tax=Paraburkholderia rhizosphaerae TaxID=480658 RepID=UPI001066653E|nr:hypothetical protein [Paraburkholderia rhizosphaerae]